MYNVNWKWNDGYWWVRAAGCVTVGVLTRVLAKILYGHAHTSCIGSYAYGNIMLAGTMPHLWCLFRCPVSPGTWLVHPSRAIAMLFSHSLDLDFSLSWSHPDISILSITPPPSSLIIHCCNTSATALNNLEADHNPEDNVASIKWSIISPISDSCLCALVLFWRLTVSLIFQGVLVSHHILWRPLHFG